MTTKKTTTTYLQFRRAVTRAGQKRARVLVFGPLAEAPRGAEEFACRPRGEGSSGNRQHRPTQMPLAVRPSPLSAGPQLSMHVQVDARHHEHALGKDARRPRSSCKTSLAELASHSMWQTSPGYCWGTFRAPAASAATHFRCCGAPFPCSIRFAHCVWSHRHRISRCRASVLPGFRQTTQVGLTSLS